ncbi:hypothetical protein P167DRAFT_487628 [Morchella conica CCBAS932]|uniref:Pentatricopeptide repeat protein n=1 Tax=Morchella conica CCBAS932 TaxID=1392247 RepID=A0A3N4KTC4_9PEZI|nr:hypothetical protein P167DRAFT_487628 [Morchella conica CCBAS932]
MLNSTASRAIAPTTARLQLRLSTLRLSTRYYAKPSYQPAPRRYNGGDTPREGRGDSYRGYNEHQPDSHSSGYNSPNGRRERRTNIRRDGREYTSDGYKLPRVGRNTEYEDRKYNQRQDTRERQPASSKDGETDWLAPRKKKSNKAEDTIIPQLTQDELRSIFSQELFVFRCDLNATQITSAMFSYPQLRDVGILTSHDVSNLARQLHTHYRLDRVDKEVLPHVKTLITDIQNGKVPGNPLASVHILSCLKEMEEFDLANDFWKWLEPQNEDHTDARVYGAAIECLAYQGTALDVMEDLYTEALERYSDSTVATVARDTGKGTRIMLFQGIITARLLHGDWEAAYEGFDICIRLYPTLTPPRIYELIIYERSVKEAYIAFLMACRAGTPPKPTVLTPLLKQLWSETGDVRAMIRALYAFVGSGGKTSFQHLNSLIGGVFGTIGQVPKNARSGEEWDEVYANAMTFTRNLISAFAKAGVQPSLSTFNTIITLGGKLERMDLVYGGLKELASAGMEPNIITYRIILNAFGELKEAESVRQSWADLCSAKAELGTPFDFKDTMALIKV